MGGYLRAHGISHNSAIARSDGRMPATHAARALGVPSAFLRQCPEVPSTGEWHHCSRYANEVDHYDVDSVGRWLATDAGKAALAAWKAGRKAVAAAAPIVLEGRFRVREYEQAGRSGRRHMRPCWREVVGRWELRPGAAFGSLNGRRKKADAVEYLGAPIEPDLVNLAVCPGLAAGPEPAESVRRPCRAFASPVLGTRPVHVVVPACADPIAAAAEIVERCNADIASYARSRAPDCQVVIQVLRAGANCGCFAEPDAGDVERESTTTVAVLRAAAEQVRAAKTPTTAGALTPTTTTKAGEDHG